MASYSSCFIIIALAVLSQFLSVPASALAPVLAPALAPALAPVSALGKNAFIDANCERVNDKAFCIQTLTTYPPTIAATSQVQLSELVIGLAITHCEKTAIFAAEAAKKDATLKADFSHCHDAYVSILASLKSAKLELKDSPDTANYDVMVTHDDTRVVMDVIGKNTDPSSKTLMEMTLQMEKLIDLAVGATDALDDGDERRV